jgi:hypothetical protein
MALPNHLVVHVNHLASLLSHRSVNPLRSSFLPLLLSVAQINHLRCILRCMLDFVHALRSHQLVSLPFRLHALRSHQLMTLPSNACCEQHHLLASIFFLRQDSCSQCIINPSWIAHPRTLMMLLVTGKQA